MQWDCHVNNPLKVCIAVTVRCSRNVCSELVDKKSRELNFLQKHQIYISLTFTQLFKVRIQFKRFKIRESWWIFTKLGSLFSDQVMMLIVICIMGNFFNFPWFDLCSRENEKKKMRTLWCRAGGGREIEGRQWRWFLVCESKRQLSMRD